MMNKQQNANWRPGRAIIFLLKVLFICPLAVNITQFISHREKTSILKLSRRRVQFMQESSFSRAGHALWETPQKTAKDKI